MLSLQKLVSQGVSPIIKRRITNAKNLFKLFDSPADYYMVSIIKIPSSLFRAPVFLFCKHNYSPSLVQICRHVFLYDFCLLSTCLANFEPGEMHYKLCSMTTLSSAQRIQERSDHFSKCMFFFQK